MRNYKDIIKKYSLPFLIVLIPFLMFHWFLPFVSNLSFYIDHRFSVEAQMESLFAIKNGTFPLYVHLSIGDFTASYMLLSGQMFLPFPYLASLMPGYWTGYAQDWNLLFQLMTLPVAHLALFFLLRRLTVNKLLAFLLSALTVYNPRYLITAVTFGPWAAHLLLCAVIGLYYLRPTGKKGPLLIIAATYWVVASPQAVDVYYSMITVCFFTLVFPFFVPLILSEEPADARRSATFWGRVVGCVALGILLASADLVFLYFDTIQQGGISSNSYDWAIQAMDTPWGVLSNFFSPLRTSIASFGETSVYLIVALIPLLSLLRIKIPPIVWVIYGFMLLIVLHMMGPYTPVHYLFWKYLPLASNIRLPARISFVLPMPFMLMLIWMFHIEPVGIRCLGRRWQISPRVFLSVMGIVLLTLYVLALDAVSNNFSLLVRYNLQIIPRWVEPLTITTGFVILAAIVIHGIFPLARRRTEFVLCILICLNIYVVFKYNPIPWFLQNREDMPTLTELYHQKSMTLNICPEYFWLSLDKRCLDKTIEHREKYVLEPQLGAIYRKFRCVNNRDEAYQFLNSYRKQDEIVIEGYCEEGRQSNTTERDNPSDRVTLTYSSYNRLVFSTQAAVPSFFMLSYARSKHWKAWVNGESTPSYRANGYAQAVRIPAGESIVEFRYWSNAAFWGLLISCLSLTLLGCILGFYGTSKPMGYYIVAIAVVIAGGLFFLWYHSLYSGRNFNTHYHWETPSSLTLSNLAYNKKTRMSSIAVTDAPNAKSKSLYTGRYAVDGGTAFPSCSLTDIQERPWWEIDLGRPEIIDTIMIYMTFHGREKNRMHYCRDNIRPIKADRNILRDNGTVFNKPPFVISISKDGQQWESTLIDEVGCSRPLKIKLEQPASARYIRIRASGICRLCLDEVEVYPPLIDNSP